jgi:hypothetical protein
MNYILVENKPKYIEYFQFVPMDPFIAYGKEMFEHTCDGENDYAVFNPSHKYAYKVQLQKFIQETNQRIDNTYFGNGQCGIQNLPRNEMLKRYVPDGDCPFINQTILSIKKYFEKNNLSFDKFCDTYPNHKIIFDTNISNYDKIHYVSNKYDEIEKNINRMRYSK